MPSHTKAGAGSRLFCLELQTALKQSIPNLQVSESKDTCGLYEPGRNRFAYVYHRTDQDLIRVYFRGDASVKPIDSTGCIDIDIRPKIEKGWDKEFPYFFVMDAREQAIPASKMLLTYSYPLSVKKRSRKRIYESTTLIPEEIPSSFEFNEGSIKNIRVNIYERNQTARAICIEHYGTKCYICNFDFELIYGERGKGFTHVHHIKPLAEIKTNYQVNPLEDLRPVCPNCHAMIHRTSAPATCEEIRQLLLNSNIRC